MRNIRFQSPVIDDNANELYSRLYGEDSSTFIEILKTSPYEMSVISRLIAYLADIQRKEKP